MALEISSAETWKTKHLANKFINFSAFDYTTVKQALIDYIKLYHPEFNNWIESDELVTIVEAFSYISELYSYRLDMIGNENLLSTAKRKDSILKLAKFISYNPSRNIAGSGLVKLTSIQTSESVYDVNGNNLRNAKILWNDPNNVNWKSQFFSIINHAIKQSFGDVLPKDRIQLFNQIFEVYSINNENIPLSNGVIPFSVPLQNKSIKMELVSSTLSENGPIESRPLSISPHPFNILYGTDGLGDASDYTGFFIYTKQGSLSKSENSFDGVTPHQTYAPSFKNINDSDVWVTQLTDNGPIPWNPIDTSNANNIIYNNQIDKNIYEIESLDEDKVKIVFGDGEFTNIPEGKFEFWFRLSDPNPIAIPKSSIDNIRSNIAYYDASNNEQNLIFTFSLNNPIQNASPSEDTEHIKLNAPYVYYSQNRMVNHKDYSQFLLQDNTILKMHSVNRVYSGQSKYTSLNDPSDTYANINHYGTDLSIYVNTNIIPISYSKNIVPKTLITNYITALLSYPDVIRYKAMNNITSRRYFTSGVNSEQHNILFNFMGDYGDYTDMNPPSTQYPFVISYDSVNQIFVPSKYTTDDSWLFYIDYNSTGWIIKYKSSDIIVNSPSTKFWYNNPNDTITILNSNKANYRTLNNTKLLSNDIILHVEDSYNDSGSTTDYHSLKITIPDANNDGIPDIEIMDNLINNVVEYIPDIDFYTESKYARLFDHVFDMPFDSDEIYYPSIELDYTALTQDISLIGDISSNSMPFSENNLQYTKTLTIKNLGYDTIKVYFKNKASILEILVDGVSDGKSQSVFNLTLSGNIVVKFKDAVKVSDISVYGESIPTFIESNLKYTSRITIDAKKNNNVKCIIKDYVYFKKVYSTVNNSYVWTVVDISENKNWLNDSLRPLADRNYDRKSGRSGLNYLWKHKPISSNRINPSSSNIIDCYIITRGYYYNMMEWIKGTISDKPVQPLPHELRTSYNSLMNHKMVSDEMILRSGELKILFGKDARKELQAKFLVVKSYSTVLSDIQIKSAIVDAVYSYFSIDSWNFGDSFNFTEMAAHIHNALNNNISSIVIKPLNGTLGDLFQILAMEHEILIPSVSIDDIEIVEYLKL